MAFIITKTGTQTLFSDIAGTSFPRGLALTPFSGNQAGLRIEEYPSNPNTNTDDAQATNSREDLNVYFSPYGDPYDGNQFVDNSMDVNDGQKVNWTTYNSGTQMFLGYPPFGALTSDAETLITNPHWSALDTYGLNAIVDYTGNSYICIDPVVVPSATPPPSDAVHWKIKSTESTQIKPIDLTSSTPDFLVGQYDATSLETDKNSSVIITVAQTGITGSNPAWVSGGSYTINNIVNYNTKPFKCILDVSGSVITPDLDTSHWIAATVTQNGFPVTFVCDVDSPTRRVVGGFILYDAGTPYPETTKAYITGAFNDNGTGTVNIGNANDSLNMIVNIRLTPSSTAL